MNRRDKRLKAKYDTYVSLSHNLLVICTCKNSKNSSVNTKRRFKHMWNKFLPCCVIHICLCNPTILLMLSKVKVSSIRKTVELLLAKWEVKFNINCSLGIMCKIRPGFFYLVTSISFYTNILDPSVHFPTPFFKKFCPITDARIEEIFKLHEIKLS